MLMSKLLAPTLREVPAEAEVISHKLLLRAGFMRKAAGGVYSYLPLGLRVLRKIENIVREEMNRADGEEILMPITQPAEIWHESGRWQVYGDEMFRLKDRHGRDFCLGPTHEEMITTLVKGDVRSYRQLPLLLYQMQNKYRDEIRPRFGLMRGREFIMKDAYSFDRDEEALQLMYDKMYKTYERIFTRCGLTFRAVEADPGAIGGNGSHEFMVLAEAGEADVAFCEKCDYAANTEKAELSAVFSEKEVMQDLKEVVTPNQKSIEEVSAFLEIEPKKLIKSIAYNTEKGVVLALVRGDHQINEIKLKNLFAVLALETATENILADCFGSIGGFIGPMGLKDDAEKISIVADLTVMEMYNAVCGANKKDTHLLGVNPKRDFKDMKNFTVADIRLMTKGDPCPRCSEPVAMACGIEVGQVFKLGTKYSKSLGANYLDENGREKPMVMGCYGIGVSRTMAAAIEQNNDKDGIIWPLSIAPYHVIVLPVSNKDEAQMKIAQMIYENLKNEGIETVFDDRNERVGVKFKDADLIGYPVKVVVGGKSVNEGFVEIKMRKTGEVLECVLDETIVKIKEKIKF